MLGFLEFCGKIKSLLRGLLRQDVLFVWQDVLKFLLYFFINIVRLLIIIIIINLVI